MRPLERDGTFGAKSRMEYILDDNGERIKLPSGRYKTKKITTTDWDDRGNAELWRKNWADTLNKYLEYYDHEARVDHRSYERQGLDILPTIHLGAVAHAMEQKGIRTERGDINRAVIAENERIKLLNKEIRKAKKDKHDILNPPPPPKPQFIIDIENSIKAKDNPAYEHWARIFNIQQMAKTLLYIQNNGYTDIKSLESAHQNATNDITNIQDQITETKDEIKALKAQKEQVEIYRKTRDVYQKYTAPGQFSYFKNQFYEKNKADIEAHKKARGYIYDELKLEKMPSLKRLSGEITELTAKQKELQEALPTARKKENSLKIITHNTRMILGYRELEMQNINPVEMPAYPEDLPVYKSSFAEAEKSGELAQYFQSRYFNKECAEAIRKTLSQDMFGENDIRKIIKAYEIERIGWVLAAAVENNTTGKLATYKKWASEKGLPNEPNSNFGLKPNDKTSLFIAEFQDVVRKIKDLYQAEQRQFNQPLPQSLPSPSYASRVANAQKRVDEYNQNRAVPTPAKPKKSKGMEI